VTSPELVWGSAPRGLGVLAATTCDLDTAERHFEDAIEPSLRMGAAPWVAHARDDRARMLLARGAPGDRERADCLLDQALGAYRDLGMAGFAARAAALRHG